MAKHYEVVIYTASLKQYADPLMDILDPERLCTSRLYREHCTLHDSVYVKDLSLLGRHAKNVILVDNSPNSYKLQPQNAVPIKTWYEDPTDIELSALMPFLAELAYIDDVRKVLAQCVTFSKTGEIDEDLLDAKTGLQAIRSLMSGDAEDDADSLLRQDFDSFEEQGQKSETKTKELTYSAD